MATAVCTKHDTAWAREILERYASLQKLGHSEVLGLTPDADPAAVKAAYLRLVRRFHPDTAGSIEGELRDKLRAVFIRITEAYQALARNPPIGPQVSREGRSAGLPPVSTARVAPGPDPSQLRGKQVEEALAEAESLLAQGEADAAVEVLHGVFVQAHEPARRRLRLLLARAYSADASRRRYAVRMLGEMLQATPDDSEALTVLGALYHKEGLRARAESTLRQALASDPGNAGARALLRAVSSARPRAGTGPAAAKPASEVFFARLMGRRVEKG